MSHHLKSVENSRDEESKILCFLQSYKSYLAQCIDYKDLLFYKHFCIKKRTEFREKAKIYGGEYVTQEMLDCIILMDDIPDRFTALLKLFKEEIENEKALKILNGENVPCERNKNREKIQKEYSKEICENLQVCEIIPELLRHDLIVSREANHLKNKARQETCFEATLDFLQMLPSRNPHWYPRFMSCLLLTGHKDLALKLDQDLCQSIISRMKEFRHTEKVSFADDLDTMSLDSGPLKEYASVRDRRNQTEYSDHDDVTDTLSIEKGTYRVKGFCKTDSIARWLLENEKVRNNIGCSPTPDRHSPIGSAESVSQCSDSCHVYSDVSEVSSTESSKLVENEKELHTNNNFLKDKFLSTDQDQEQKKYQTLYLLFTKENLNPVKMLFILKDHPELLNTCMYLEYTSKRAMQFEDESFALRAHYISRVIKTTREAESIDELINNLLTGRKADGYQEFQDDLVRQVFADFPYKSSTLFNRLLRHLNHSPKGDGLTSLRILIEGCCGNSLSACSLQGCPTFYKHETENIPNNIHVYLNENKNSTEDVRACKCPEGDAYLESLNGIKIENLDRNGREYRSIEEYLQTTGRKNLKIYTVTSIKTIHNKELFEKYAMQKRMIEETGEAANERYLFHWSSPLRKVIDKGFFSMNTTELLQGDICFSNDPSTFENRGCFSCDVMPCGCRTILICRVTLGDTYQEKALTQSIKIKKGQYSIEIEQMIHGTAISKYIVVNGDQVYPEYLVAFKTVNLTRKQPELDLQQPVQIIHSTLV